MFESARLKLTAWYLLIIMTISLLFSAFIYKSVTSEFQRRLNTIERRFDVETPRGWQVPQPVHEFFIEDLRLARKQVLFFLLYANGTILLLSAVAGYYLAGKTLLPIEVAMGEQKRFIADASHELKTPLTALQTAIEVALRDKKLSLNNAKKLLRENLDDISKLTSLSNNLLALARMQSNGQSMNFETTDIKDLIAEVAKKIKPLASEKNIKITTKLKSASVSIDKVSIEKLITVLLDNAIKYTPKKGTVVISTAVNKKCITLEVKDTGVGISKKDLPHIFERFYRIDPARSKTKTDGFGLGLSIAKRIVELHKGKIKVESKLGKGTTVVVKLPKN